MPDYPYPEWLPPLRCAELKDVLLELPVDKQEQISSKNLIFARKIYLQILIVVQKLLPEDQKCQATFIFYSTYKTSAQVCNHPHLANGDILPEPEDSSKLEQLLNWLRKQQMQDIRS